MDSMNTVEIFDFSGLEQSIRPDLTDSFRAAWAHIAAPGPGWSSAERVAIADEARRAETCVLCRDRKAALSPNSIKGTHDSDGVLSELATDVVHRISSDAERLSKSFYEQTLRAGLSDSQWVEIVGIVSTLKSIDAFHRALGLPVEPLPESTSDAATGYRPEGLSDSGGWVPMIRVSDLAEPEKMLYHGYPRMPNVLRSMSLVPDEVRNLARLSDAMYLSVKEIPDFRAPGNRVIDRLQIELIAARVSSINECFY